MNRNQNSAEDVFYIRRREDFDLFCSPIRASILEYLVAFGPMPAREISARIGRSAALTHHHLGILVRGGLVREIAREKRGKHLERIFAIGTENW
ncbi:MAG: winged helix-turn-helix domain-containing protein, partial [Pirellula sp.]